jgi:hypothetical protein
MGEVLSLHIVKAYRRSRGIAPHILNLGSGWRVVGSVPQPLYCWGIALVRIAYKAEWATGLVSMYWRR